MIALAEWLGSNDSLGLRMVNGGFRLGKTRSKYRIVGRKLPAQIRLDFFVERAPATPPPQR